VRWMAGIAVVVLPACHALDQEGARGPGMHEAAGDADVVQPRDLAAPESRRACA